MTAMVLRERGQRLSLTDVPQTEIAEALAHEPRRQSILAGRAALLQDG
jgi:hypothetical protein